MADSLNGRKVAIIATSGVEQVELVRPREAVVQAGGEAVLVSPPGNEIQAMNNDLEPADTFPVDGSISDASPDDYDALLLPGGTVNADRLRLEDDVISFVKEMFRA